MAILLVLGICLQWVDIISHKASQKIYLRSDDIFGRMIEKVTEGENIDN